MEVADLKAASTLSSGKRQEIQRTFKIYHEKLHELDHWLPKLKEDMREFFRLSTKVKQIYLQIDDLYHLRRADQAFVVDYIHRLCKDMPIYFKLATLRHASTLYVDRDGQPIGAQERHDYQPINIDYTFVEFKKTADQNWKILAEFAAKAGFSSEELKKLFKGEGFSRLVMAGGGVPRDVLSLFLEVLDTVQNRSDSRIGKDDVRTLSKSNFERRITELKQDAQGSEQDTLIRGIYLLRSFCLERKTNIFNVSEKFLQQNDEWKSLFFRLLDYRIIHQANIAGTHKTQTGTFQAFAIDLGCYAHLRKLEGKMNEIDVSDSSAKDKMRSAPVLDEKMLQDLWKNIPDNVEEELLSDAA